MRFFSVILLVLVSAIAFSAPADAKVVRDVIYADAPGIDPGDVRADIYMPENAQNAPMIIMMHGGAWTFGNKQNALGMFQANYFTDQGFVFVAINYRLAPAHPFPAQEEDAAAAIAYFHKHAGEFGADADKIFLMGHSAGAHMAALVAIDPDYLGAFDLTPSVIKGVVAMDSAAYNLARTGSDGDIPEFYHPTFTADDPDVWAAASPTLQVEETTEIPPFLLLYVNRAVSPSRAKELAEALNSAGHHAEARRVKNRDHKSLNERLGAKGDKASRMIVDFFRDQLDD
jgi:arylformamidase